MSSRPSRRRRVSALGSFTSKLRSRWSPANVDRVFGMKRGYSRQLKMEALEDRRLLAYTAFLDSSNNVFFSGDAAANTLILQVDFATGRLEHNRFTAGDPGFASDLDLDSVIPGVQSLLASDVQRVLVTDSGINDTLEVRLGLGVVNARLQAQGAIGGLPADLLTATSTLPDIQFTSMATFHLVTAGDQSQVTVATRSLDGAAAYQIDSASADATAIFEGDDSRNDNFTLQRVTAGPQDYDVVDTGSSVRVSLFNFKNSFDRIQFNTLGGDDSLTADVGTASGSDLILVPVSFDGGVGNDRLTISGTPTTVVNNVEYRPGLQVDEGRLDYFGAAVAPLMSINFDNLEPVVDEVLAGGLTVFGNGASNTLTYTPDQTDAFRGQVAVDGFETIAFKNKANLQLVGDSGDDLIVLENAVVPTGLTSITVHGDSSVGFPGGGDDTIRILNLPATLLSVMVFGESGNDVLDASKLVQTLALDLVGGNGNDTITGGAGNDQISGGEGDDVLIISAGSDQFAGNNGADTLKFLGNANANTLTVTPTGPTQFTYTSTNSVGNGTVTLSGVDAFDVELGDNNDQLVFNLANAQLINALPIVYDGGAGQNTLTVQGNFGGAATIDNVTYTPGLQEDEGRIVYTDAAQVMDITFDNLRPINDTAAAATLVVNGNGSANAITVSAPAGSALATVLVDGFETITFNNKVDLTINAAAGDDIVNVNVAATATITALSTITINANDGNDTVRFQNLPTAAGFTRATVNAGAGDDTIDASNIPATTTKPLTLNGEEGKDKITGGSNGDIISGGADDDIIIASPGNDTVNADGGIDQFHVIGRAIADIILANQTADNTLAVTYNGNLRTYTVGTLELVQIDAGAGDDFIGINVIDAITPAASLPFNVIGNSPNASDRLIVNDDGLGDLVIQRQGPDHRSGSITIGANTNLPTDGAKVRVFYESIERVDITPITPFGRTGTDQGGRLIVFLPDEYESNDTELTATPIGPEPIFLTPVNIDPGAPNPALPPPFNNVPGDNDWYEFRPNAIGTFQFEVLFEHINTVPNGREGLPGNGNLKAEIYDQAGVLLASSDISVDTPINVKTREIVTIDGAPGFSYFLRVFGSTTDAINTYEVNVQQVDNDGPQVTNVFPNNLTGFNLFDPKPVADGATPLIHSLTITFVDQPPRAPGNPYPALDPVAAAQRGLYQLVGDHLGFIDITSVTVVNDPVIIGQPATARVTLNFATALPDDRFTLRILEGLVDPVGNELDGESDAQEPAPPHFPSGNGLPGGEFEARFTVDTRPELGAYVAQDIDIDINGNFVWDPANGQIGNDHTNVDLSFTLNVQAVTGAIGAGGYNVNDLLFSGKFTNGGVLPPRLFEQLGAFGFSAELGNFRFLIDTDGDGVVSLVAGSRDLLLQIPGGASPSLLGVNVAGAIPISGDFNNNRADGDEIGLYINGRWLLDTDHNFTIDTLLAGTDMLGAPVVGDFDGDGDDDLAVFNNNVFKFDLNRNGTADGGTLSPTWGFPGVTDRPVAADMDQDGIDDIGLWVPRNSASLPQGVAEWYFLVSGTRTAPLTSVTNAQVFASTNLIGATVNVGDLVRIRSGAAVEKVGRVAAFNAATGQITLQAALSVAPAVGDIIAVGGTQNTISTINHPFEIAPFGRDIAAEFGDELALPIVGNFDPPANPKTLLPSSGVQGDYDGSGSVTNADNQVWRGTFGSTSSLLADGSKNGKVDAADYVLWRNAAGNSGAGSGSLSDGGAAAPGSDVQTIVASMSEVSTASASNVFKPYDEVDSVFDRFASKASQSATAASVSSDGALLLTALDNHDYATLQESASPRPADSATGGDEALELVLAGYEFGGGFDLEL